MLPPAPPASKRFVGYGLGRGSRLRLAAAWLRHAMHHPRARQGCMCAFVGSLNDLALRPDLRSVQWRVPLFRPSGPSMLDLSRLRASKAMPEPYPQGMNVRGQRPNHGQKADWGASAPDANEVGCNHREAMQPRAQREHACPQLRRLRSEGTEYVKTRLFNNLVHEGIPLLSFPAPLL